MSIQKKSLINSLNTTKKAIVASSPATGSAATGTVKPALAVKPGLRAGVKLKTGVKAGMKLKTGVKAGVKGGIRPAAMY